MMPSGAGEAYSTAQDSTAPHSTAQHRTEQHTTEKNSTAEVTMNGKAEVKSDKAMLLMCPAVLWTAVRCMQGSASTANTASKAWQAPGRHIMSCRCMWLPDMR